MAVCMTLFAGHSAGPARGATQPDIIVVMVDDLGGIDNRILDRLPNIRSLFIDQGLKFTSAYSETPLCCPGRASFLTGQHTRHHGVVQNDASLLDPSHTIATTLQGAGYYTMMVGKYLNGAAQLADHTPPGWDEVAMLNDWSTNQSSDWWIQDVPVTDGYFDRFIADQATQWLGSAPADKPIFMWLTPHAPHKSASSNLDWVPDIEPRYATDQRCSGIEPWHPPSYDFAGQPDGYPLDDICRSLLTVDDMVGQLRDLAAAEGRDPVWLLTSDNGMAWGEGGFLLKNVPVADRLPLYFSGPGIVDGHTDALVSNIDFAPTLADLAGTTMPTADGKSFASVLRGDGGGRKALLEDHPVGGPTGEGDVATGPWWAVRTPHWYLVVWNGVQLYDSDADPWELTDVAADHPDVVSQLEGIWNLPIPTSTPAPTPTLTPTPTPTVTPPPDQTSPAPSNSPPPSPRKPGHRPSPSPTNAATATPTGAAQLTFTATVGAPSATPPRTLGAAGSTKGTPPSSGSPGVPALTLYLALLGLAALMGVVLGRRLRPRSAPPR